MLIQSKTMLADFRPLKAWRYDCQKLKMADVIAPPYDIISPQEQKALYVRHANNCIRLILNQREATDSDMENPYTRARDFYQNWKKQGVLVQEKDPSYYLYRQLFCDPFSGESKSRMALIGRLRLEPFEKGIVVPHEKTLSKAREDRKKLLEATATNFSPVFGLYDDPTSTVKTLYGEVLKQKPLFEAVDDKQVTHQVWGISEEKTTRQIHEFFQNEKIYIADGHHRYTTALEYSLKQRALNPAASEIGSDFVLMALVEFQDPGMILFPTHRWILPFEGYSENGALEGIKKEFDAKEMDIQTLKSYLEKSSSDSVELGIFFQSGKSYLLTLRNFQKARKLMPEDHTDQWCKMDVAILSHLVLKHLWNLPETQWENTIKYTHSTEEAISEVRSGKYCATFLLKAPTVKILKDMGESRELLPQKSTYFWPKLASGLVFYSHH